MRESPFEARRSSTVLLLIALVAVFFLELVVERILGFSSAPSKSPIYHYFALSLSGLEHGCLWQLLTYQFMHAGPWHLLCNCWAIYVFGQELEMALGHRTYLTLYFSSGVLGGITQALASLVGLGPAANIPVVGASAAAFGLAGAYAMLFPNRVFLLFFVLPMRAKWLVAFAGGFALYGLLSPFDYTANAAHLGGLVTGLAFVRYALQWQWPSFKPLRRFSSRRLVKVPINKSGFWPRSRPQPDDELPTEEFVSKEVDPILDKISAQGINSLTERERRILEAARAKMGNR